MTNKIILGLTLFLYCLLATAQDTANADKDKQYVTDQLRLSLYENPDSQSRVLKLLQSGDLLIIDEIRGAYALVTAPGGTRGWVKRGFLVTSPTSNILLREERDKNAALTDEIEKLADSKVVIDTYEKDMDALVEKNNALEAEQEQAIANTAMLQQRIANLQAELERKQENGDPPARVLLDTFLEYWKFIVPGLLVLLALSFFVSKLIVETRIKSKFHGIKIW